MTKQKDLKRHVRARMQKTGESYTTARTQLRKKKVPPRDLAKLAGMSNAAVRAKTGKTWTEWLKVLDTAAMQKREHRDIAAYVCEHFDITEWWAQTVTVGYERIHGLRAIGQRRDGTYEANKSKTVSVPVEKLYAAFAQKRLREQWLNEPVSMRKTTKHQSVRMTATDGTPIEAYFTAKGAQKSQVALQQRRLQSKAESDRCKSDWGERLKALAALVTKG